MRILSGDEAIQMREIIDRLVFDAIDYGFQEIILPIVEPAEVYTDKMGSEILNQMYTFKDKKNRDLVLRPEGTATIQLLARETFKDYKDLRLFYVTKCYRYERPQEGRYREFTQFGVEILWPRDIKKAKADLVDLSSLMVSRFVNNKDYEVQESVKRGLAYYVEDGFEISIPKLGAQKQVCGGGAYAEGIGFAIGIDRLLLAKQAPIV